MMQSNKITALEMYILGLSSAMGTILRANSISGVLAKESWLAGIPSGLCFLALIHIYSSLAKRFPGKGFVAMLIETFGGPVGKAFALLYSFFFLTVLCMNTFASALTVNYIMLLPTPRIAICLLFLFATVYSVHKGFVAFAKAASFFILLSIGAILVDFILATIQGKAEYLFPVFQMPFIKYVQATFNTLSITYGDTFILMAFLPYAANNVNIGKTFAWLAIGGMILVTIVHIRETIILGPLVSYLFNPTYETLKLLAIGNDVTRLESFLIISHSATAFIKITLFFFAALYSFCDAFGIEDRKRYAFPLAILAAVYSAVFVQNADDSSYYISNIMSFIWFPMYYVMPALVLLVSILHQKLEKAQPGTKGGA